MATASSASPIAALQSLGQCAWLDFMSREFLDSGELKRLIEEDNLQGVTSNPTIFDKAISHSADYDEQMKDVVRQGGDADAVYYALTTTDIGRALDLFRPDVRPDLQASTASSVSKSRH